MPDSKKSITLKRWVTPLGVVIITFFPVSSMPRSFAKSFPIMMLSLSVIKLSRF